ncbi:hypothetical protein [Aureibacillus halotolerans]|uniref:Uncharacterized protein n=1 Tax=Aureibacillus halotolerans TaxID=1508390 RepID=A0A4R6TVT1_9BACI|nr:hypothetical protein [Aureibacillus halotolerans]TDQ36099.1 hypothetical protein EV213_12030 [Aureibacillus halotolerans]
MRMSDVRLSQIEKELELLKVSIHQTKQLAISSKKIQGLMEQVAKNTEHMKPTI